MICAIAVFFYLFFISKLQSKMLVRFLTKRNELLRISSLISSPSSSSSSFHFRSSICRQSSTSFSQNLNHSIDLQKRNFFVTKFNQQNKIKDQNENKITMQTITGRCGGCGIDLQTKDRHSVGFFVPPEQIMKEYGDPKSKQLTKKKYISKSQTLQLLLENNILPPEQKQTQTQTSTKQQETQPLSQEASSSTTTTTTESISVSTPICQRCFVLKNYGKVIPVSVAPSQYAEVAKSISKRSGVVLKMVDILDFEGSFVPSIWDYVGTNPVVLVANKIDLLPQKTDLYKVKQWLRTMSTSLGFHPQDAFLISSKAGTNVSELMTELLKQWPKKDIFVVGSTNSGKSTLVNYLVRSLNLSITSPTISPLAGTTLATISVPFGKHRKLFDTPGLFNTSQLGNLLTFDEFKAIEPTKPLKPRIHLLNEGQSLLIGGMIRVDFISGSRTYFTAFFGEKLKVHRTTKPEHMLSKHTGTLLTPPSPKESRPTPFPELSNVQEFQIQGIGMKDAAKDLVIAGLGWIALTGAGPIRIRVYSPPKVQVILRDLPLLPFVTPAAGRDVPKSQIIKSNKPRKRPFNKKY